MSSVLSQKSQYAVRAILELAKRYGPAPVKAATVAEAQCIPLRFLENILGELRRARVVDSTRGKEGGYQLTRSPRELSVGDVIRLVQGPLRAVDCPRPSGSDGGGVNGECALRDGCVLLPMWEKAQAAMMAVYDGTTFDELVEEERMARGRGVFDYAI